MRFFATVDKALGIHVFYCLNAWSIYKYCLWIIIDNYKITDNYNQNIRHKQPDLRKKTVPVYHLANKPDSVTIKNRKQGRRPPQSLYWN